MSCNACGLKFNFFHRELGCANCGISFCSKCLKQKCKVPKKNNEVLNVCKICYSKMNSGASTSQDMDIPPPDAYLKRLENLENPSVVPITIYQQNAKLQKLRTGLSPADLHILERLEKLREDRKNKALPTTDSEIRNRLANLRGENPYADEPKKNFMVSDDRTTEEKVDSLLEQFISEKEIMLSHKPQGEIEARLANLREEGVRPNEGTYISNLHDSSSSEEEIHKITRKIMDEVALEDKSPDLESANVHRPDSEELPWCVICNKDASVRCLDCSGDLYCSECNVQFHESSGDEDHKRVAYQQPQKKE